MRCWNYCLGQRFQTGGSRITVGPKQDFRGSEMRFSRVKFVCSRMYLLSKQPRFLKDCNFFYSRALSSIIVPANFTKLTVWLLNAWIAIASHCVYLAEAGRWSVCNRIFMFTYLWWNYSMIIFDATELDSFWCSTVHRYQKLNAKAMSVFQSPMQHESGLSFLFHFKNKYGFKPLERFVRGSE